MNHFSMMIVASGVLMLASLLIVDTASPAECIKDSHTCIHKSECCSGCCVEEKCAPFSDDCNAAHSPCSVHECPPGKQCYLQQVQCVAAPCLPVPACKDQDYDDYN
ncbi:uncharacterized protein LOC111874108 [Cryptotermes secundus]|uniref:uncharacterized protein LOC111874108 n=1 Tax=Cryptotermes secundus TaxID=105785 RepID=UPI000CD7B7CF|nr:uncharacterized protein LOC111874108 [Cryptotermes secundus]XP_033611224.1 uncharacterized protein LOC111874108 [Cryptotermes secundus]XP_033611225.1 uncharacterized protein LOC111874108 [Cryptotermes secundus]